MTRSSVRELAIRLRAALAAFLAPPRRRSLSADELALWHKWKDEGEHLGRQGSPSVNPNLMVAPFPGVGLAEALSADLDARDGGACALCGGPVRRIVELTVDDYAVAAALCDRCGRRGSALSELEDAARELARAPGA